MSTRVTTQNHTGYECLVHINHGLLNTKGWSITDKYTYGEVTHTGDYDATQKVGFKAWHLVGREAEGKFDLDYDHTADVYAAFTVTGVVISPPAFFAQDNFLNGYDFPSICIDSIEPKGEVSETGMQTYSISFHNNSVYTKISNVIVVPTTPPVDL